MSILVGATPEVSTLSLHDALPICVPRERAAPINVCLRELLEAAANLLIEHLVPLIHVNLDRKSTRLNSSHVRISYAVFCLKKKKFKAIKQPPPVAFNVKCMLPITI